MITISTESQRQQFQEDNDIEWLEENVTNFENVPVQIAHDKAQKLVSAHSQMWGDYLRSANLNDTAETYRAKTIFEWLGY